MRDLVGKTALVTGAASGIGRATALALAEAGARLVVCDVNEPALAALARELDASCLLLRRVDVSDRAAMKAFADEVHAIVPAVDVLVNNAGVGLHGGLLTTSLEDWDWVLKINLGGVVHGCHFFVPKMVARGEGGHVVNVSSVLGVFGAPSVIGYATSKFGVFGLSESLRAELATHGIGVSTICPGAIDTGIIAGTRFMSAGADSARTEKLRQDVQEMFTRRRYRPEKVAAAIVDAVRRGKSVVPVAPEAWAMYLVKRFAPSIGGTVGRVMAWRERAMSK
jgi:NAD(P)-dependent dehydrogenase (short-subunit alcohol dehydrogenase family)